MKERGNEWVEVITVRKKASILKDVTYLPFALYVCNLKGCRERGKSCNNLEIKLHKK